MIPRIHILTAVLAFVCSSIVVAQQPAQQPPSAQPNLDKIIVPIVKFQQATIEEALEYLRIKSSGASSDKGVSFVLIKDDASAPAPISVDLKDVPLSVALKYCVELAGLKYRVETYAVVVAASFDAAPAPPPVVGNADKIILPIVQFSGATLEEAVEYFRVKARDHDPVGKGVNIIIKPGASAAKIGLDLRNVPLPYVLDYSARLSNCQLTTDGNIYVFSPLKAR